MPEVTHDALIAALSTVDDPEIHKPITELGTTVEQVTVTTTLGEVATAATSIQ